MALIESNNIWSQVGHLPRVTISQGQELQPNARNFIDPDATEILWPDPANLAKNTLFTVYRAGMSHTPDIISNKILTVFDRSKTYGDGAAVECRVPFDKYEECLYIFNGAFIQELPTTSTYDNLSSTLYESTFTSSGTFAVSQSNNLLVTVVGGGGGGGGEGNLNLNGGGGGAGAIVNHVMTLPEGTVIPITVGGGGSSARNTVADGGAGGTSSFGDYLVAYGGTGGGRGYFGTGGTFGGTETIINGYDGGDGGAGGTKGTDVTSVLGISYGGNAGGYYNDDPNGYGGGGGGGASALGNGGSGGTGFGSGNNGGIGAGGGGEGSGSSQQHSGSGGSGIVIIKWGPKGA